MWKFMLLFLLLVFFLLFVIIMTSKLIQFQVSISIFNTMVFFDKQAHKIRSFRKRFRNNIKKTETVFYLLYLQNNLWGVLLPIFFVCYYKCNRLCWAWLSDFYCSECFKPRQVDLFMEFIEIDYEEILKFYGLDNNDG